MNIAERDQLEELKRDAKDWRSFALFWFAMTLISMGAFLFEAFLKSK